MRFMKYVFVSALLPTLAVNAYALDQMPGKVTHPIHIKRTPAYMNQAPSGLSPQQIKTAYGLDKVVAQGENQIIAIVNAYDDPFAESDLGIFSSTFNLPACTTANKCFKKIYASGTQPPLDAGWAGEIALDVQWAHAIAPKAKIFLVEAASANADDIYKAVDVAVKNGANVVSMSWGAPEGSWITALNLDQHFNVPNVTFLASSGDSGNGVMYPAASPYVIAVGGTTLQTDAKGNRLSESAWVGSGGGLSVVEPASAQQKVYSLPNNPKKMRGVPDVAYDSDPNTGFSVYNSVPDPLSGQTGWFVVGGTSDAAPQWAGMVAVANSIVRRNIPVDSILYNIAKASYALTYYDTLTGQNGSCGYFCQARSNYDYVTGLGTPHSPYLINMMIRS